MYKVSFFLVLVTLLPCACLEMPISHVSKVEKPVVYDAGEEGGLGPQQACYDCLHAPEDPGPGCKTATMNCRNDPKCNAILDCGFEDGCFQGKQVEFFQCGYACLEKRVTENRDKVLDLAAPLFQCLSNGACGTICFTQ